MRLTGLGFRKNIATVTAKPRSRCDSGVTQEVTGAVTTALSVGINMNIPPQHTKCFASRYNLGGGFGNKANQYTVQAIEVVLPTGKITTVSTQENRNLFCVLRVQLLFLAANDIPRVVRVTPVS